MFTFNIAGVALAILEQLTIIGDIKADNGQTETGSGTVAAGNNISLTS